MISHHRTKILSLGNLFLGLGYFPACHLENSRLILTRHADVLCNDICCHRPLRIMAISSYKTTHAQSLD